MLTIFMSFFSEYSYNIHNLMCEEFVVIGIFKQLSKQYEKRKMDVLRIYIKCSNHHTLLYILL
jgi:hypothetical protein